MSGSASDDVSKLTFVGGPLDGQEFPLEAGEDTVLGSDPDCVITLPLENVAAQHARLTWGHAGLVIVDLDTASGTYVNGEKIQGERTLEEGDRICLGPPGSSQSAKILAHVGAPPPADEIDLGAEASEPAAPADSPRPVMPAPMTSSPDVLHFDNAADSVSLVPVPEPDFAAPLPTPPPPPAPAAAAAPAAPAKATRPAPPVSEPEPEIVVLETEVAPAPAPVVAPPPAAAAPAARAAAAPRPASPPTPDYQMSPPSIGVPDRPRQPVRLPPAPAARLGAKRPAKAKRARGVPRIAVIGAAALLIVVGTVFGLSLIKKPAPVLKSVPPKAEPGQVISIVGEQLAPDPSANTVRFGDVPGTVLKATKRELTVKVPALEGSSVSVVVETRGLRSNSLPLKIQQTPRIRLLKPDVALPGAEILIEGMSFGGEPLSVSVRDVPAEVLDHGKEALRVRLPQMAFGEGDVVPVVVKAAGEVSKPSSLTLGHLPLLAQLTPKGGRAGVRVTLKGAGFATTPAENLVTFGGQPALVVKAQANELVVLAPGIAAAYDVVPVSVKVGEATSRTLGFSPAGASLAAYVPHFFPAAVPEHAGHDHVMIASEIGPVLLLSGRGDSGSGAERAERAANQLNQMVELGLRGQTVTFEFREGSSSVGASADPSFALAATAQDAAGYSEAWDSAVRPVAANPKMVARHWAAILQDYFTLFVARQRPSALAPLTPRGKVLLDLFAEAARRGGPGAGVPTSLVSPLSATLAKNLRDMALLLPGSATAARASAVIEGLWDGTMRDGDLTRPIQIRLESQEGRLSGTATLRKGSLSFRSSLGDVTFDKGSLRFALNVGTGTRYFRGTLAGDQLKGTIHTASAGDASVGEFTLRFTN